MHCVIHLARLRDRWRLNHTREARQSSSQRRTPLRKRNLALGASLFIASCEGSLTTELAIEAPANPQLQQVVAPLLGLEFQRSDGGTETLEFDAAEAVDLAAFAGRNPVRLFTDEELPEGSYTGVRLLFDEQDVDNTFVIDELGAQRELTIVEADYAPMQFSVEEEESTSESLILTLDLRLSLSSDADDDYTLDPVLRSMPRDQAGGVQGAVEAGCASDDAFVVAAVYLFEGEDVIPDDADGQNAEPFATAPVLVDAISTAPFYELRNIPEGTYTLALACGADLEDPSTDDELDFQSSINVDVDESQITEQDL